MGGSFGGYHTGRFIIIMRMELCELPREMNNGSSSHTLHGKYITTCCLSGGPLCRRRVRPGLCRRSVCWECLQVEVTSRGWWTELRRDDIAQGQHRAHPQPHTTRQLTAFTGNFRQMSDRLRSLFVCCMFSDCFDGVFWRFCFLRFAVPRTSIVGGGEMD